MVRGARAEAGFDATAPGGGLPQGVAALAQAGGARGPVVWGLAQAAAALAVADLVARDPAASGGFSLPAAVGPLGPLGLGLAAGVAVAALERRRWALLDGLEPEAGALVRRAEGDR